MMNEINYKEIVDALKVLKNLCNGRKCDECPLGDNNCKCKLTDTAPTSYNIIDPTEIIRLLR